MHFFFFKRYRDHRDLHSFPTRRSSDLLERQGYAAAFQDPEVLKAIQNGPIGAIAITVVEWSGQDQQMQVIPRSEEHTSELQSLRHLVCRLLLEKKKNRNNIQCESHLT